MSFYRRIFNLFRRPALQRDLDEELAAHLELRTEDNRAAGMSAEEARRDARLRFGSASTIREDVLAADSALFLDGLWRDIQLALRLMRRAPLLTGTALLSVSLSIGATAVVFTAIKTVLLNPLPYAHVEQLVQLRSDDDSGARSHSDWIFWKDTQEIIRRTRTLESVGVYRNAVFDLGGRSAAPPEALYGIRMTASLFPTLGVSPILGRNILPDEDQRGHVEELILSYGLWSRRFHKDAHVIGRSVRVNSHACTVVGVMPQGFNFPLRRAAAHTPEPYVEFWAPLQTGGSEATEGGMGAVARLRPGVSITQAQQDLASINGALVHEFPAANRGRTLHLAHLWGRSVGSAQNALWFLLAAALLFLLIGCANVSNLLLARGLVRQREIAVRMAIGAGRPRIVRQLLTESCVLSLCGGLGGFALTVLAWKLLPAIAPVTIPRLADARPDSTILAFSLALSLFNGVLFGIMPAFRSARTGDASPLGARGINSGRQDWFRTSLVAGEVAVTVTLVLVGGQLLGSFLALIRSDPGFSANRVLASVVIPEPGRYVMLEKRADLYHRLLNAVLTLPGVESAGVVDALPFSGENHGGFISVLPNARTVAEIDLVGGRYLQTLGVRLLAGRWFRPDESDPANQSIIISDTLAHLFWPQGSAIGKRICVDCTPEHPANWKLIVGVVSDSRHASLEGPPPQSVYLAAGAFRNANFLVVRTSRPAGEMSSAIKQAIAAVDSNQPVLFSASLQSLVKDSVADQRFITTLLTATGMLALLMCLAGVYGVTSYITSRRTQEIGLRMALGATSRSVHVLLFRQGFAAVSTGLVFGLAVTAALTHVLRGVVFGLETGKNEHSVLAGLLLVLVTALACWYPARRASRTDPMSALRQE